MRGTKMKKIIPLVLIMTTLGLSSVAMAKPMPTQVGFQDSTAQSQLNGGGFNGGLSAITTVEQAKQLSDKTWVVLRGKITKQIGKKDYLFIDSTGEISVEIGQREWSGQSVTPNDLVELAGKIDKDWNSVEIDVKSVKVIQDDGK